VNSNKVLEKILQKFRFDVIIPFLYGNILDFGCNHKELKKYGNLKHYFGVNNINDVIGKYDTIVMLAVLEHMSKDDGVNIIKQLTKHLNIGGSIVITTPTRICKYLLEFLSIIGLLDKENIKEHKYYWNYNDFVSTFNNCSMMYEKFQLRLNQLCIITPTLQSYDRN